MVKLTKDEKKFLAHHKIPDSALFDASGMGKTTYRAHMKALEKTVALNTTPCKKKGHRMRTRAGHCMQCNVAAHAYLTRHINTGQVYIAGSKTGSFIKIGTSKDFHHREASLNAFGYGGVADWEIIYCVAVSSAGAVEFEIQQNIAQFAHHAQFYKDYHDVNCLELFKCKYSRVKAVLNEVIPEKAEEIYINTELEVLFDQIDEVEGEHIRFVPKREKSATDPNVKSSRTQNVSSDNTTKPKNGSSQKKTDTRERGSRENGSSKAQSGNPLKWIVTISLIGFLCWLIVK